MNKKQLINDIIISSERSYLKKKNDINIHEIIAEKETICDKSQAQQYTLWPCEESDIENVHLMLIGETGKGKTTLINGILNFVLDINCHNVYRFCVPVNFAMPDKRDIDIQTEKVTLYKIPYVDGMRYNKNLLLTDTPGLLDTRGIEYQKQCSEQVKLFLEHSVNKEKLIIGIVAEANLTLDNSVKNLINLIQEIVQGLSNVKIILIATFATIRDPPMFSLLKQNLNVKVDDQFKINNKIISSKIDINDEKSQQKWLSWESDMESLLNQIQT
ncbi:unnamed protein product [Meganyctiphanes norvegica]|uniref:G domain-containing protein n=1 Tax=Meganyctiphanes norvegica TaxID=48144 RepID=A0AAV2RMZ3_MEGNR